MDTLIARLTTAGTIVGAVVIAYGFIRFLTVGTWPALIIAVAIVVTGLRLVMRSWRVLVDEALPPEELDAVREAIESHRSDEVAGFHKLRARRAGSRRYIDLHVQFRAGTTLERAHQVSHELQAEIRRRVHRADVLIHIEPETRDGRG